MYLRMLDKCLPMGPHLGHTGVVSDRMLVAAAEALPPLVQREDLQRGTVYLTLDNIRGVSKAVAKAVMLCAKQDGHMHNDSTQKAVSKGDAMLDAWVDVQMTNLVTPPQPMHRNLNTTRTMPA
ncbi:hypothetical protein WJX77_000733 [Trebouxia sp. C0004]